MSEHPGVERLAPRGLAAGRVDALATRAIEMVAANGRPPLQDVRSTLTDRLTDAVVGPDRDACLEVAAEMIAHGFPRTEIADRIIPEIALRLGEAWCADTRSFAEVTIGSSRLQSILRDLGPEWCADTVSDPNAPVAAVLVAAEDDHTLGALLVTGQLRRKGLSVKLVLGCHPGDVAPLLDRMRFDAIMISASKRDSLATLRQLVDSVRAAGPASLPVVLGGSVVEMDVDVRALTGADFVTNDSDEALRLCGLKIPARTEMHPAPGD